MGKTSTQGRRAEATAARIKQEIERGGARFWRYEDFEDLPTAATAAALSRLSKAEYIQRVGKGVYYRPEPTSFGPSLPPRSAITVATAHAPIHPAGLTAANFLGLTTQNPATPEYAIAASSAPKALRNASVHTGRPSRAHLTAREVAILETLRTRGIDSDLSPEETVARLKQHLGKGPTFRRLAKSAKKEPPRVRAMLGALGQELFPRSSPALESLRNSLNPLSKFDFGYLSPLKYAKEWQAR